MAGQRPSGQTLVLAAAILIAAVAAFWVLGQRVAEVPAQVDTPQIQAPSLPEPGTG